MSDEPTRRSAIGWLSELHVYYALVGCYFFAFGLQFVVFPSLVAFVLGASAQGVGLAQAALAAPMFCLLLFGGVLAERAKAGPTLALLQLLAAGATLALASAVRADGATYGVLIAYALAAGACAAFIMPTRDAALNGVVAREGARGRGVSLSRATAATTAVQVGAQIAGILVARFAGADPAPFLVLQAVALAAGAGAALLLQAPKPQTERADAFKAIREGVAYVFRDPVMAPMLISAASIGVFMIGAFQVLFPLLIRESYRGDAAQQAHQLGTLFACFWGACFVSAALLGATKPPSRPGRMMIASQLVSAALLLTLALEKPFWLLMLSVVAWGLAAGVTLATSRAIVQSAADRTYLGRVLSIYSMGYMGGTPIGALIAGFAASLMGARLAALLPATGLAIAVLALALATRLWRLAPQRAS